jgi:hypothetical protein
MTIFTDDDLSDTPILTQWQIVGGLDGRPRLFGTHAFHEGTRIAAVELLVVDPMLRWAVTTLGGYRLAGGGTAAVEHAKFGTEREH